MNREIFQGVFFGVFANSAMTSLDLGVESVVLRQSRAVLFGLCAVHAGYRLGKPSLLGAGLGVMIAGLARIAIDYQKIFQTDALSAQP